LRVAPFLLEIRCHHLNLIWYLGLPSYCVTFNC
jgi:hypothetical protein